MKYDKGRGGPVSPFDHTSQPRVDSAITGIGSLSTCLERGGVDLNGGDPQQEEEREAGEVGVLMIYL